MRLEQAFLVEKKAVDIVKQKRFSRYVKAQSFPRVVVTRSQHFCVDCSAVVPVGARVWCGCRHDPLWGPVMRWYCVSCWPLHVPAKTVFTNRMGAP